MEMQSTIRKRLLGLRKARNVSQDELSKVMGMNNRQSLADLEIGERAIQPQELLAAAQFFGVAHSYFTDPLELAGEASFSWRKSSQCDVSNINAFEQTAGRWIATYRHLGNLMHASVNSSLTQIEMCIRDRLECQLAHFASFLCIFSVNRTTIAHKICTKNPSNCAALPLQVLMENLG